MEGHRRSAVEHFEYPLSCEIATTNFTAKDRNLPKDSFVSLARLV
jgi:hypothetical protein